jgi:hypothetical protein
VDGDDACDEDEDEDVDELEAARSAAGPELDACLAAGAGVAGSRDASCAANDTPPESVVISVSAPKHRSLRVISNQ